MRRRRLSRRLTWAVAAAATLGGLVVVTAALASTRFRKETLRRQETLASAAHPRPFGLVTEAENLPAPVRRYLEVARPTGPSWRLARLAQRGELRGAPGGAWIAFESEQLYSLDPPAFVWSADARVAPGIHLLARDTLWDDRGRMRVALQGLIPVADGKGAEIDQGAVLRFWGEVIAFPEAVTHPSLRWEEVDATHARVHIEQGAVTTSALVEFGPEGLPVAIHAQRYRDVGGVPVLTAWSGYSTGWRRFGDRLFPSRWASTWHLPSGDFVAVRMDVLGVTLE